MRQLHQQVNPIRPKRKRTRETWLVDLITLVLVGPPLLYLLYLFVSVVYGGESSACPQNLCQ